MSEIITFIQSCTLWDFGFFALNLVVTSGLVYFYFKSIGFPYDRPD